MLIAVIAAVVAAVAVVVYLVLTRDDAGGETNGGGSTTPSAAEDALRALPRSPEALDTHLLVLPRVENGNTDLHLVDAASGETAQRLTSAAADDVLPVMSPDRRSIAFARVQGDVVDLRVIAADGHGDSPLFSSPPADCAHPSRPAWNPLDPTQVALICSGGDSGPDALRLYTLDGATVRTLETGHTVLGDLAISPDGTVVGYWAGDDRSIDGGDLYTLAVDGSGSPQQITDVEGGADADMVWSHEGGTIAFRRDVRAGERRIFVMHPDGTDQESITSGSFDQDPIFSPDDAYIAFKSNRSGPYGVGDHMWVISISARGLTQLEAPYGPDVHAPAWGHR